MTKIVIDKEVEIAKLSSMLENLTDDKDEQSVRFAINLIEGFEERPQGEWAYDNKLNNWKCSECGETPKTMGYVGTAKFMHDEFKFCNHCGAKMIGGVIYKEAENE